MSGLPMVRQRPRVGAGWLGMVMVLDRAGKAGGPGAEGTYGGRDAIGGAEGVAGEAPPGRRDWLAEPRAGVRGDVDGLPRLVVLGHGVPPRWCHLVASHRKSY